MNYKFKTEEFSLYNFPKEEQLGWLADEVMSVAPELVSTDSEGYQAVAYSHATALVAQAVKELKQEKDAEIAALKSEVGNSVESIS